MSDLNIHRVITLFLLHPHTYVSVLGEQVQQVPLDAEEIRRWCQVHIEENFRDDGDEGVLPDEGEEQSSDGV